MATAVAVVAALFVLSVGWRCPIQLATGYPCPTCGMTRALRLVLRGDFAAATQLHPLVWLTVPAVALLVTAEIVGYAQTAELGGSRRVRGSSAVMLATATLLFTLWLLRFAGRFGGPV
jgi:hypothetical protein